MTADEQSVIRECMRRNGLNNYIYDMAQINVEKGDEVESRADFQCDQTEGFPASLVVNWTKQQAWLELNESLVLDRDEMELNYYRQRCKDWGVRPCVGEEDYNNLLKQLGDEAYENAAFYDEEQDMEM